MVYNPGFATNSYGFLMTMDVDLGYASKFTTYEAETNTFKVHSTLVEVEDIGIHTISFTATFMNSTYSEKFEGSFNLTIYSEYSKPLPDEYHYLDEW